MPKISVVVPCYNGEKYIGQTIESVQAQIERDWELVIVNDGSHDSSAAVINSYAANDERIHYYEQENQGISASRNNGFAKTDTSSQYVMFLDHDDTLEPDAFTSLLAELEKNPQAIAAHGLMRRIDENNQPIPFSISDKFIFNRTILKKWRWVQMPDTAPTTFEVLVIRNIIATPGQGLVRRSALKLLGAQPFRDNRTVAEDWDFWLRLSLHGDIIFLNKMVINYRSHSTNFSNNRDRMGKLDLLVYQKLLTSPDLTPQKIYLVKMGKVWREGNMARLHFLWAMENLRQGKWLAALKLTKPTLRHLGLFSYAYVKTNLRH